MDSLLDTRILFQYSRRTIFYVHELRHSRNISLYYMQVVLPTYLLLSRLVQSRGREGIGKLICGLIEFNGVAM